MNSKIARVCTMSPYVFVKPFNGSSMIKKIYFYILYSSSMSCPLSTATVLGRSPPNQLIALRLCEGAGVGVDSAFLSQ